ncbi:MAG: glycerol-3-phosphate 1-O-acyltransferase PlsY [Clostridia bacterium]|nr:glycerol-3-phosphate 1-O-acyltransferase PlsY [Clostridia bacterium]
MFLKYAAAVVIGYLLGSISTAIIGSKLLFRKDIRTQGSGNAGATNSTRVYGVMFGIMTLAGDFLKGLAACLIGRALGGVPALALAGAACLLGHCFPVYFSFKGGKGISTGAAIALMIDWRVLALALGLFIVIVAITRIVSPASVAAAVAVGVGSLLFSREPWLWALGIFTTVLVVFMHRANIGRLIRGEEKQFRQERR